MDTMTLRGALLGMFEVLAQREGALIGCIPQHCCRLGGGTTARFLASSDEVGRRPVPASGHEVEEDSKAVLEILVAALDAAFHG